MTMVRTLVCYLSLLVWAVIAFAGPSEPVTVYSQPGWCTWCPTPTRLPDGRFALVHSRWPEKCGFESWCMKSEIALAVADTALGPYRFVGTLLGGAGTADAWDRDVTHNPYLFHHGGKYYLYYMGTRGTEGDRRSFLSSQRIGVAVADKAEGPWRRAERPVFPEDPRRAMCSNPSVCAMPDGRILMVYKWMVAPWSTNPEVHLGAAIALRPEGPFEIVNENVFPAAGVRFAGEDPCLWTEGGKVVCVIHDMGTNYSPHSRALVRFESEDGVRWTNCGALLARGDIHRLERPYVLALPEGERLLFAASKPSAAGESSEIVAYPGLLARKSVRVEVPLSLNRDARFDNAVLRATTDHADALYRCGEKMVFTLKLEGLTEKVDGAYYLNWTQQRDDGTEPHGVEPFDLSAPKVFETSIDRPGFVRYCFTLLGADKRPIYKSKDGMWGPISFNCECGAGAEPEKLDFLPEPKDFDAFWGKQLAELRKVPRNAKVEQIPFKDAGFDCYRLSIPCAGGRPVTGYMTVPRGPKDAKWPLNISFHGYGTFTQTAPKSGPKDKIDISINAHGYDLDRESDYYKEFWNGVKLNERGQYGMVPADNARPETSYFRGMVLRAVRAVEWAKTLPNWDGKNLRVWGGSQGGMQSLWVAALVDGITELEPIVPWGADIIGKTKGRYSFSGLRLEYAPGLDYYDTVNFAKRIPATCRVNISRSGLGDIHCPPSGQWLLYRAIKAPKSITFLQNSNHGGAPGGKEKNQHTTYSEGVAKDATKSTESSATSLLGDAWRETK